MPTQARTQWQLWCDRFDQAQTRESRRSLMSERFRFYSVKNIEWRALRVAAGQIEEQGQPLPRAHPKKAPPSNANHLLLGAYSEDPFVLRLAAALEAGEVTAQSRVLQSEAAPVSLRIRPPHPTAERGTVCADVLDLKVEKSQHAQLQMSWAESETSHALQVSWTRIHVSHGASLHLVLDAAAHSDGDRLVRLEVILEEGAHLSAVSLHGGARHSQFQAVVRCQGADSSWTWKAGSRMNESRFVELQIRGDHPVPRTQSRLDSYMILGDQSRGVFRGSLSISPEGVKTRAEQRSRALLLSKQAVFDALPDLEIATDDVQCAHGATVAPVDENQVFYLASRGISRADATQMLVDAFVQPVLNAIEIPTWRTQAEKRFGMSPSEFEEVP